MQRRKSLFIFTALIVILIIVKIQMLALGAEESPTVQTQGDISYITGGVGEDERIYMKALSREYNLHVLNAGVSGELVSDVNMVLRNANGDELLNTEAGPMFFALLPDGKYILDAFYQNNHQTKTINIHKKSTASVQFFWK